MNLNELRLLVRKELYETIKKVDGKYVVYPKKGGKRLGTHSSRASALKQLGAIEASKARHENIEEKSVPQPYDRNSAREMTEEQVKRRDVIGKKLLKTPDAVQYFKTNFGDEWEDYLWATATNIAIDGGE